LAIRKIDYFAPSSLEEACEFLYEHGADTKPLAGGQSMIPLLKMNLVEIKCLMDLKRIQGLSEIRLVQENGTSSSLEIGALTKHSEIQHSTLIRQHLPLLSITASGIGHPLIRNRGTIGGSLCHCDPSADYTPTLLNLEAKMTLVSRNSTRRTLPIENFLRGPFETNLEKGELLEKITIPIPDPSTTNFSFKKFSPSHGDFPLVLVSVLAQFIMAEKNGIKCKRAAIALGGVADRAFRVTAAEDYLIGLSYLNEETTAFEKAATMASQSSKPTADIDFSSDYKRKLVKVLTYRALVDVYSKSLQELGHELAN
jgi:glyceraldehyde dehydrogenase medium subunit